MIYRFVSSSRETAAFPVGAEKSWVKIATLVINCLKKVEAFCVVGDVKLRLRVLSISRRRRASRVLRQITLSEGSIKNTSLLLLLCGCKSGRRDRSPTEPVVRKKKRALLLFTSSNIDGQRFFRGLSVRLM